MIAGLDRLLGLRQRRAVGDVPRVRILARDLGDADGLPDRPARRPAPAPGGLGGIDGGLLGALVVYGTPAATTAAAVLAYRVILFWLPLLVGAVAFMSLRRGAERPGPSELCVVPAAA